MRTLVMLSLCLMQCAPPSECEPGARTGCSCDDGRRGNMVCEATGRFAACRCGERCSVELGDGVRPCACGDGATGTQDCAPASDTWDACDCRPDAGR